MIKIRKIDNGFMLTRPHPNTDGDLELAFTFDEDKPEDESQKEQCETVKNLLWEILEEIKPYSKHDKYNVVVNVEKDGKIVE